MTLLYIRDIDVAAYHQQGWICTRLPGHHGARRGGKNYLAALDV